MIERERTDRGEPDARKLGARQSTQKSRPRERFAAAFSNKRRQRTQTAAALGIVGGLAALSLWAVFENPDEGKAKKSKAPPAAAIAIHPEYVQRETYIRKSEAKIDEIAKSVSALSQELRSLRKDLDATTKRFSEAIGRQNDTLATLEEQQAKEAQEKAAEAEARETAAGGAASSLGSEADFGDLDAAILSSGEEDGRSGLGSASMPRAAPQLTVATLAAPADRRRAANPEKAHDAPSKPRYAPAPWLAPDSPIAVNRAPGSTIATYLPPGAFARATLLTGVYASTGGAASDPMPVLMKVENAAILPNKWRTNIDACMLTGAATGDLSSERVQIRLDRLSCVGKNGETLDVRISGYAVGADGKVGIRGRLVTRSGQAIAAAISTSMLQGIGRAVSLSSQTTTTSLSSGTQTVDYANAWRGGLGDGFAKGMDRISAYFLRLAEKILPVLEVDAGSPVDIVVSQGVRLSD